MGARRFTGATRSWKNITASLLSACSGTSMLLKCDFPRGKDIPNGSFGFLHCSLLWAKKSLASQAKNPLRPSKKKPFIPDTLLLITDLLACAKNVSPPIQLCAISTNPASLKAEGKEPQIRSGLWRSNTSKNRHQTQWTDSVLFARRAQTWLRSRGVAYRTCRHRASAAWEMIFDDWLANLFQILKLYRAQIFPQGAFTRCVLHGRVPCQSVDHLTITAIPQKRDYLGKQCLLWILIAITPVLRDFVHEEREDFFAEHSQWIGEQL